MAIAQYNSGVMQVTGTTTATSLKDLMNTAVAGKGTAANDAKVDFVILNPEGVIRYTIDGQTPTAAIGLEGVDLSQYELNASLEKIMIIGAVKVNIAVGFKSGA